MREGIARLARRACRTRAICAVLLVALVACARGGVDRSGGAPARPAGSPAGPASFAMLVLGDSLALGTGARDPENGVAFRIYRTLARERPGAEVTDVAIGGARAADVLRLEIPRLPARADLVLLIAGGNDVVRETSPVAFAASYGATVAAIRARYPHAAIVLGGVPDVGVSPLFAGDSARTSGRAYMLDRIVRAEATQAHLGFIDLFGASRQARGDAAFLSEDQFHPSDRGYEILAARAMPPVRAALARRPKADRPRAQ